MSSASSPDCILRPEDKVLKMGFPVVEQSVPNSFDEFFHRELYSGSEDEGFKKEDDEVDNLFAVNAYSSANEHDSTHAKTSQSKGSPSQPWRKGLWCLNQNPDARLDIEKTRKAHDAPLSNISPVHLVANDNFALRSPKPSTRVAETKDVSPARLHETHCLSPLRQQRTPREMNLSPGPIYSRSYVDNRNGYVDAWQQDFQNFNLQLNDDGFGSFSTQSAYFEHLGYNARHPQRFMANNPVKMESVRAATMQNMSREAMESRNGTSHSATHELSTITHSNLNATSRNMFTSPPDGNDLAYQWISEDLPSMSDWATESLHSSNSSHHSQMSNGSYGHQMQGLQNTVPPQTWWSPPTTYAQTQPTQASQEHRPVLMQPKPRRATYQVLQHNSNDDDGLGIKYPSSEEIGVAVPYRPPELQPSSMPPTQTEHQRGMSDYVNALSTCPSLPPAAHSFPEGSPFVTPQRQGLAPYRTPSPPISPTHRCSRSTRQRSPSRRDPSQHRRKSIHKSGPVKDSAETSQHRSTSRPPRTPKTPKTPNEGLGSIDFVNFTPKDAVKLLNDVAPSGSSKTRARREQEAREKRKKLSEAAINAVRNAGGDVEALERVIRT
ncbi:hypothetical protein H2198_001721 [Neophaeococcomyces mojaviensis]|uniref:Uncharacterized protein n=1 Tax=Neophaeococcomyces mojaviensis TaxID=3383035 RepID=A0ACC3AGJ9_9EURO|nr:hypothetical protein H2198_001721 [Knufia sp. JES_112]